MACSGIVEITILKRATFFQGNGNGRTRQKGSRQNIAREANGIWIGSDVVVAFEHFWVTRAQNQVGGGDATGCKGAARLSACATHDSTTPHDTDESRCRQVRRKLDGTRSSSFFHNIGRRIDLLRFRLSGGDSRILERRRCPGIFGNRRKLACRRLFGSMPR